MSSELPQGKFTQANNPGDFPQGPAAASGGVNTFNDVSYVNAGQRGSTSYVSSGQKGKVDYMDVT